MTGDEKLVYMANQIASFFESMNQAEAVDGIADHINKFWEPRMRRHFFDIVERGGKGLKPVVVEAAAKVKRPKEAA
nr:formate dehydrogenase subunit delta [Chelativorans sp. J32]